MSFSNFKSATPTGALLPAGSHTVAITKAVIINSFMNYDRSANDWISDPSKYPWDKPTDQILLIIEDDKKRQLTLRLNGEGFMKSADFTPEELEAQQLDDVDGFAAKRLDSGKYQRINSEPNTQACHNIVNKLLDVAGIETGSSIEDFLAKVVAETVTVGAKIVEEDFGGKTYRNVSGWFSPTDQAPVADVASL